MHEILVRIQFMYMTRSPLRVKENFLDRLIENIKGMRLPEKLELSFMALAIKAFGLKTDKRIVLCNKALDALDLLERTNKE